MHRPTLLTTLLCLLFAIDASAAAAAPTLQSIVEAGRHPHLNRPDFGGYRAEVRKVYEANRFQLLWLQEGRPTPQANEIIDSLLAAKVTGLLPADYNAGWLDAERLRLATAPEASASFDTGLTISLMRFVADSYRGRVDPRAAGFELDFQPKALALAQIVLDLSRAQSPSQRLTAYEPPFRVYDSLKAALERMRRLAAGKDLPEIPPMPILRPGGRDRGVPLVRQYLALLGYIGGGAAAGDDAELFDNELAEAVARFQQRYGLEGDGVLGRQTQRQMRVPLTLRVKQIELAMERLRWLPYEFSRKFILVNLPEFRLRGFNARDEPPAVAMGVVVGTATKTETPVLYADMRFVVFRPYWNVPSKITLEEVLPSLRRDPHYLAKHNYEIVAGRGAEAQILPPTAESLAQLTSGGARLRQQPGEDNSLGLVKFIFPNPSHVYLHDTPSKSLFHRSRRDFSHGCIRVENPVALARFVLGEKAWSDQRVTEAMHGADNRRVNLPSPVQILLYYTTVVAEDDGEVYFFDDIYGYDAKLAQLLAKGYRVGP